MCRTFRKTLTNVLAIWCVTSALALATDSTLVGTVQNVDPQQGRITVRAGEDNVVEARFSRAPDRLAEWRCRGGEEIGATSDVD
jgi:hypothetical protein